MRLMQAVEQRRKYLQYQLWTLGVRGLSGNETLSDLERMHIIAKYEKGNQHIHA